MKPLIGGILAAFVLLVSQPAEAIQISWKDHARVHSLAGESGHYVLVHFWASWCSPCRDEMPELAAWAKAHPNVVFVPISLDDRAADAAKFLKADNLGDVPVLMGDIDSATQLNIRALPTTMIIDPEGNLVRSMRGARPWGADTFSQSVLHTLSGRDREVKD